MSAYFFHFTCRVLGRSNLIKSNRIAPAQKGEAGGLFFILTMNPYIQFFNLRFPLPAIDFDFETSTSMYSLSVLLHRVFLLLFFFIWVGEREGASGTRYAAQLMEVVCVSRAVWIELGADPMTAIQIGYSIHSIHFDPCDWDGEMVKVVVVLLHNCIGSGSAFGNEIDQGRCYVYVCSD